MDPREVRYLKNIHSKRKAPAAEQCEAKINEHHPLKDSDEMIVIVPKSWNISFSQLPTFVVSVNNSIFCASGFNN